MQAKKQAEIDHGDGHAGGVKRMVIGSTTAQHGGMRFESTTRSARVQANGHVSEMQVHVNRFVNNGLGNVK